MNQVKKALYLVPAIVVTSCATPKVAPVATTQQDVKPVEASVPDKKASDLEQGKMLYERHCFSCHGIDSPKSYSVESWQEIVPRMCVKVNKKENNVLDQAKQDLILNYLVTLSSSTK